MTLFATRMPIPLLEGEHDALRLESRESNGWLGGDRFCNDAAVEKMKSRLHFLLSFGGAHAAIGEREFYVFVHGQITNQIGFGPL